MEGNFRYSHVRVRTYNESIAFFNGEDKEKLICEEVKKIIKKIKHLIKFN